MPIVPAGVHTPRMNGTIRSFCLFLNGQRIRICPEGDGILFAKVKEGAQGAFHRGKHLAVQPLQGIAQIAHCLGQASIQFRDSVQGAAVFNQLHSFRLRYILYHYIVPFPQCQFFLVLFRKK